MVRFSLAVSLVSMLLSLSATSTSAELPEKENFHLYLLVGQSNMAGRGKIDDAGNTPHPRVMKLSQENEWVPATDPLHFDKPKVVGVGVGKTFGEVIAEANPDVVIGLIPCAVGGSPIDTWQPGGYHEQTKSPPWDDAIKRAHVALQKGTLKGILWHQGESDSTPTLADTYEQKLEDLIARFRKELNAPQVPFLIGQLGQFDEKPWNESRRKVDLA